MIGSLNPSQKEATVIGAGISGLAAAYYLDRSGYEVTLIEKSQRPGGLIQTHETSFGISEQAAHSFLATRPIKELCDEINVELLPVQVDSKARFIYRNHRMRKMPLRFHEIAQLAFRAMAVPTKNLGANTTFEEWGRRHLGQPAVNYLVSPFLTGIYGATASEISPTAAFPRFPSARGLPLAARVFQKKTDRPRMVSPKNGMSALTDRLSQVLEKRLGSRYQLGNKIEALPDSPNLVLTPPAPISAHLIAKHGSASAEALDEVEYVPLIAVTLFLPHAQKLRGVGVLVPPDQGRRCLGILFNSSSFALRAGKLSSFTLMFGGSRDPDVLSLSDDELKALCEKEFEEITGRKTGSISDEQFHVYRWPQAIPLYSPQLPRLWERVRSDWCACPGRILFGNYSGDISIRGMIEAARKLPNS